MKSPGRGVVEKDKGGVKKGLIDEEKTQTGGVSARLGFTFSINIKTIEDAFTYSWAHIVPV